jgi:protein-disulfide isomerase
VQVSRSTSMMLALVAFAAAAVLGRSLGTPHGESEPVPNELAAVVPAQARKPAEKNGGELVYKIPVSISQARLGPADALVTLVQWCDLPDAGCEAAEPVVQALLKEHPAELSLVFRHYLSDTRPDSARAHQFSRVAHEHAGKFWEARALLLAHSGPVTDLDLEKMAGKLGLDWAASKKAMDDGTFSGHVAADRMFAEMFDVHQTPAFFANGRPLSGAPSEASLRALVEGELARARKLVATGVQKDALYAELTKNGVWNPPPRTARTE